MCVCVCVRACVHVCVRGWAGACAGGVRFSNSNRIIPSDYRILLLLKMPIPNLDTEGIQSGPPFGISRALIIFPTLINAC